jgi:uncharacterized protein (DUF1015 family)
MRNYPNIGVQVADILLPHPGIEPQKWSTIACDQFTSQPDYWDQVKELVGDAPSTVNIVLPEIYLEDADVPQRIELAQKAMENYLEENLLIKHEGMILVKRSVSGKSRHGLVLALDLERYDFNKGSQTLIRATEGTIIERLPPRMKIREGAALETPHILVLIDDPDKTVVEPLTKQSQKMQKLYDLDLMLGSGKLEGYLVDDIALEKQVINALDQLSNPETFYSKYSVESDKGILLFAMGDGNHSLATAKAFWEKIKPDVTMDHPARYALVEIENIHDEGLEFEPIHRVLFGVKEDYSTAMQLYFKDTCRFTQCASEEEMVQTVSKPDSKEHVIGVVSETGFGVIQISKSPYNLPVGTLQNFLETWLKNGGFEKVDYVHGQDVVCSLGIQSGNLGFYLPAMRKSDLFTTVILDGALPRKTFSMGEAEEKRFYMECRQIT